MQQTRGYLTSRKSWRKVLVMWMTCIMIVGILPLPDSVRAATTEPILHYELNESSGSSVVDTKGVGPTGTLINLPSFVPGLVGNALNFNGTDSYVNFGNTNRIDQSNQYTIEAWVNPNSAVTSSRSILSHGVSGVQANTFWLFINNGQLRLQIADKNGGNYNDFFGGAVPANKWTHIALTRSGTTFKLYVNGVVVKSVTLTSMDQSGNNNDLRLGGISGFSAASFDGKIDELKFYDVALDDAALAANYASVDKGFNMTVMNGTIVASFDKLPLVSPAVEQFAATIQINGGSKQPLPLADLVYDPVAKTATLHFVQIQPAALHQSVSIEVTYQSVIALGQFQVFQQPGNATDWFHDAKYGVGVHWTSKTIKKDKTQAANYCEAVNNFDVNKFAQQLDDAGAGYILFTINHVDNWLPFPSTVADNILPGRTCTRDLPAELYDLIGPKGIKMMFYYNWDNPTDGAWRNAVNFNTPAVVTQNIYDLVDEIGNRYGSKLAGWWIDGMYDAGPRLRPFTDFSAHLRTGNPDRIVALSTLGQSWTNNQYDADTVNANDYAPGESMNINRLPSSRFSGQNGVQWQEFTNMTGNDWLYHAGNKDSHSQKPNYSDSAVIDHIRAVNTLGGVFTYNAAPYQDELIPEAVMDQLKAIKNAIRHGATKADESMSTSHTQLTYTGNWSNYNGAHYARTSGASMEYSFNGSTVSWTGITGSDHGKADVYIDGVLDATVDMYSAKRESNVILYSDSGLSDGPHTIKIVVRSDRNSAASDTYVEIISINTFNPSLSSVGAWDYYTTADHYNGAGIRTTTADSALSLTFAGNSVNWIGVKDANHGLADVYLDGVLDATVDLYSSTRKAQAVLYSRAGLSAGNHTIKIVARGEQNVASSGNIVAVDAIEYYNSGPVVNSSSMTSDKSSLSATDSDTAKITVQLTDGGGNPLNASGGTVTLNSTLGNLSPVTDKGDGTYEAVLTASSVAGMALVTGTLNGVPLTATQHINFILSEKTDLFSAISVAQSVYGLAVEGTAVGQYPVGAKAVLQVAIDAAQWVANDVAATQDQVNQAISNLNNALQVFNASVITKNPDTGNGSGNGSGTGVGPNPNPNDNEVEVVIDQGTASVQMRDDQTGVAIPVERIGDNQLQVQAGPVTVTIDKQVQAILAAKIGDIKGATIVVQVTSENVQQNVIGQVYDISVKLKSADGTETNIGDIAASGVSVTLPVDVGNADKDLLGVYHLNKKTNKWEYVGGTFNDKPDQVILNLTQPGSYAVMEFNKSFTDVPAEHWAYRTIKLLSARHLINGVSDNEFSPSGKTTRAEFTALLVRVLGLKTSDQTTLFNDVSSEDWFAKDIAAAYAAGLVQGVNQNEFGPDQEISREQMATLLLRAYEHMHGRSVNASGNVQDFTDSSSVSPWAKDGVGKAIQLGLMKGKSGRVFDPKSDTLRAEAAQAILNLLNSK
ncbi:S-layer homology domain-containing protein [Paenibacillus sp. LHD-117]|uniref:S-layer homology domain-containing protein n=1 Tax=Paenibacillus sp. LHD-117 TaxID=3071412 RepID=UPI0027DFC9A4|nr:S-layer homology domain-containing protein [Paenibacillus sp. LHD-117]MDQ6422719.1 S-layer homology domain-containing protein [Paenibacillus sp. LHD-117]